MQCILPFVEEGGGTLLFKTCASPNSQNIGWCPTSTKVTKGGESSYSGGGHGWDYCAPEDAYEELKKDEPFGCKYGKRGFNK